MLSLFFHFSKILRTEKARQSWENIGNAQNFLSVGYATPLWDIVTKKSNFAKIIGQMERMSQKLIIVFTKNFLGIQPCVALVTNDQWMKKWFTIPSYLSVLKLQYYSSKSSSFAFSRQIEEKLFCVIWVGKNVDIQGFK